MVEVCSFVVSLFSGTVSISVFGWFVRGVSHSCVPGSGSDDHVVSVW